MIQTLPHDPHDRALRAAVAPSDWEAPAGQRRYDLLVLGAGTSGLVAAAGAAGLGARVALIERGMMGGDCLNAGCVPSKALLRAAKALGEARGASALGLRGASSVEADFPAIMERMRRLRAGIADHDGAARFTELGVDVFLGAGRFSARDRVEVFLHGGGSRSLRFKRAMIATGARPLVFPVPGLEEVGYLSNEDFFTLTELPSSLVIVGAGPIGVEMAQAFARFGSQVSVLAMDPRVLPREDPEAAALVQQALEADGVRLELGARMVRVEQRGADKVVVAERDGVEVEAAGEILLLAMGRAANVEGLGLEEAGVAFERQGVTVDDRLRTSNPRIYAAGDVAGSYQFTHAADAMARIVLRNAFFFGRGKLSALTMPWCTYTMPEVAHVGLYESESERAGCELEALRMDFSEIDRAILDGEDQGFAKLVIEKKSGRLRGATVVAPHAGELIGEAILAVSRGWRARDLSSLIHPYPTQASVWGRLGDLAMRRQLSPTVARLLRRVIRLRR